MIKEKSCGIIPFYYHDGVIKVFIVRHHGGHWGFPKGRKEGDESDLECAMRELKEETQLSVVSSYQESFKEKYFFYRASSLISKEVVYFLASVKGDPSPQEAEIKEIALVQPLALNEYFQFKEGKKLQKKILSWLESHQNELRS